MSVRARLSPADKVFGALSSPTRRAVLDLLLDGPRTASDIASHFQMSRPSVSEHLRALREVQLIVDQKQGRFRLYSINPAPLLELRDWLSPYERFWRGRLSAIGDILDQLPPEGPIT